MFEYEHKLISQSNASRRYFTPATKFSASTSNIWFGLASNPSTLQAFMKRKSGFVLMFGTLLKGLSLKLSHKPAFFRFSSLLLAWLNATISSFDLSITIETKALFSPRFISWISPFTAELTVNPGLVLSSNNGSPFETRSPSRTRIFGFKPK